MANNRGLGKGFDALLPQDFDDSILAEPEDRIKRLKLELLTPHPDQPRTHFDETALGELAQSLVEHGVLQPLVATPLGGKYIIIAGERRWRAAKKAGLKDVPVIVRTNQELEQLEMALVENVQRVDLSPLEQAVSIQKLHEQFSQEYQDIAKRLGKALSTIQNTVRLLQLIPEAKKALQAGNISEGHARTLLALKTPEKQKELLSLIQKNHWSVRQAEQFAGARKKQVGTSRTALQRIERETPETKKLAQKLKSLVTIRRKARGGSLEIHFANDSELKRILSRLLN